MQPECLCAHFSFCSARVRKFIDEIGPKGQAEQQTGPFPFAVSRNTSFIRVPRNLLRDLFLLQWARDIQNIHS